MAEDEPRQDPKLPPDARLDSLDERLGKAQAAEAARTGGTQKRAPQTGQRQGMRILSVMVSYPLGSALIGWVIDRFAGTHGIWVAMLFLGFGAAMWEVWKISQQKPE
ncbi:MAG TPA: AtpZ/AtpI family protein [Allosphingosinicella sp.]|nr:AtpZ/AtpI family protein [Allosphingosinicella sp.]